MTQIESCPGRPSDARNRGGCPAEQLEPDLVRDEVARGRMVIPANKTHLAKGLVPIGIGIAARTKINANIGKSAVSSDSTCEVEKLLAGRPARGRHRDGPLDRRADRRRAQPDHRGRHGARRHGADLSSRPAARRHRRHAAEGFPGRGRAAGPAGRRLHDDPRRACCASTCRCASGA